MVVVLAIMVWKRVPAVVAKVLDDKIAAIRSQLAEAQTLREEAEKLRRNMRRRPRPPTRKPRR